MIKTRLLSNGVKCYVINKPNFVEKQAMVVFNYGSCDTNFKIGEKNIKQPFGTAHFLEHKMFDIKDKNIFDLFTKYGGSSNAYTNFTSTNYYFSCTSNFKENLSVLLSMLSQLYVTDKSVEREKGIITQEINMYEDDPYWQVYFNGLKCCYKYNSVRESIAGSEDSIQEITPEILEQSYNTFYTYDNCQIIIVGDVDIDEVCAQIEKELVLNKNVDVEKKTVYENGIYQKYFVEKMPVCRPIYNILFKENNITNTLAYRLCVNNVILRLVTGRSSSLWYNLYKNGDVDYSFGYDYICGVDYGTSIIKGEGDNFEQIYDSVVAEFNRFINDGIDDSIIKRITNSIRANIIMDFDNISAVASFVADSSSKGIEVLDIYENYGKINSNDIIYALKNNYVEYAVSLIEPT